MLSVLFNVYSAMPVESKDMAGQAISDWLGIAESKVRPSSGGVFSLRR